MIDIKLLINIIKKYSFVKDVKQEGIYLIIYLHDKASIKSFKILPQRMTMQQVNKKLMRIRKEINYDFNTYDWKKQMGELDNE